MSTHKPVASLVLYLAAFTPRVDWFGWVGCGWFGWQWLGCEKGSPCCCTTGGYLPFASHQAPHFWLWLGDQDEKGSSTQRQDIWCTRLRCPTARRRTVLTASRLPLRLPASDWDTHMHKLTLGGSPDLTATTPYLGADMEDTRLSGGPRAVGLGVEQLSFMAITLREMWHGYAITCWTCCKSGCSLLPMMVFVLGVG